MIAAVLIGQLFASEAGKSDVSADKVVADDTPLLVPAPVHVPLTARFITAADLLDTSPIHEDMKRFVGATGDTAAATWITRKSTMSDQIVAGTFRRVLFFRGDVLVTSCASGRMPLHVFPATASADGGAYEFTNGQESIAAVYRTLAGGATVEDLFEKLGFSPGLTWRIRKTVADGDPQEILAATLTPNDVTDSSLLAEMHRAAHTLFAGVYLSGFPDRLPSLYVSMILNVAGIADANFGDRLALRGLHNYFPANADGRRYIVAGALN